MNNSSYSKQLNVRNRRERQQRAAAGTKGGGKKGVRLARLNQARTGNNMDASAQKYAKLLNDPCNAPLTEGIYPGTGGGIVSRLEMDAILYTSATATGGIVVWTPGLGLMYVNSTTITADTTSVNFSPIYTVSAGAISPPGFSFLSTTAQSFRCVAACAQMSYPGTESNRSGAISMGVMDAGTAAGFLPTAAGGENTAATTATVRQLSQHSERTPAALAEVKWFPGEQDGRFFSYGAVTAGLPANPTSNVDHEGRNSIVLGWSGFPVNTGCRIRLVLVCEWNPAVNQGLMATVQPKYSKASVVEVLTRMAKADPNWYIRASQALGSVMGNIPMFKTAANMRLEL